MIQIKCTGSDDLSLGEIKEFQGGLKNRSEKDIDKIILSIRKYGFSFPFFIWKKGKVNYCLDGHGRIKALERLMADGEELPRFPVVYIQAKDSAEAKNKLLRVNSQYGQMTMESVLEFAEGIEIQFDELALSNGSVMDFIEKEEESIGDDDYIQPEKECVSKLGEIYKLGNHLLMCGDSTQQDQVYKLMGEEKADIWITDPPYNVSYTGKTKESLTIKNDNMKDNDFREFLVKAFTSALNVLKSGAVFYIWHADIEGYNFRGACLDAGLQVRQCIIWNKQCMVLGRQDYQWKHEPCLYGWKDGASHLWASDRKQTTVINFDKPSRSEDHPTMKPVGLFEYQILNNTKGEDIVLDTFGGSGTTIIASEKNGRKCRMMELDPVYCDVIRRRWTKWARENGKDAGSGYLEPIEKQ